MCQLANMRRIGDYEYTIKRERQLGESERD